MKLLYTNALLACLWFNNLQAQETPNTENSQKQVILISIDGLRPEFYLDEQWPAPVIQKMAKEGAHAKGVKGVFPSVTYPSHTTMISGTLPSKHGIYYNTPFEEGGQTGRWYWEYETIQVPTLFSATREAGKTSGAISWPVSVGAPIDYNIPEVWSLDENEDRFAPMRESATPKGFVEELEENALGRINDKTYGNDGYLAREARFAAAATYIYETYAPDLLAVHLIAADHFQHTDGREGYKAKLAVSAVDSAIGQILESVERNGNMENTTFIITGDHGFVDIHSILSPNIWLVEAGLMAAEKDRGAWKATFMTSGAAAFLLLKDPNDTATLNTVKEILDNLPSSMQQLFKVIEKDELDKMGADPNAFLALAPAAGINMSGASTGELLRPGKGGTHGFANDMADIHTGFIAYGAGINKATVIKQMNLQDIAPIIAKLLSLDLPAEDGILLPGILESSH